MEFTHASFFSGIGGAELAAEWMGWKNVAHCEINPFCKKILNYYWPNAKSYDDITKTDFTELRGTIDIVSGGFPCQPYSLAGQRKGKEDVRHLWPHYLRAIREIQPPWVIGENVRGLVSWDKGLVFDEIQADLEAEGYEVIPFLLPACGVEAPHERERIWFVAFNPDYQKRNSRFGEISGKNEEIQQRNNDAESSNASDGLDWIVANSDSFGSISGSGTSDRNEKEKKVGSGVCEQINRSSEKRIATDSFSIRLRKENDRLGKSGVFDQFGTPDDWRNFPTQSPVCFGNDGFPAGVDIAPIYAGNKPIKFSNWRKLSIEAGGNAIVPQVIFQIFKAVDAFCKIYEP